MKVTFILKNLTDAFFEGANGIVGVKTMDPRGQFDKLCKCAVGDLRHCVTMKAGQGQFRDRVELNQLLREQVSITSKYEPRKGYVLATFEVERNRV